MDDRHRGWLLAAVGMLLVSTDSLFVRWADAGAWDIAFLVAAWSLPVYLALSVRLDRVGPLGALRSWTAPLLTVGVLGAVSQTAFISAVTHTRVANVVVIVAAAPVVAALIGWLAFGERTARRVWVAIGITTVGVLVVVSGSLGEPTLEGDLLAVLAIVAFALSINVWRRFPDISRYVGLAVGALVMLVIAAPFASPLALDPRAYLATAAMGVVFNPLGRIAHSTAPRYAPASEVALFTPVETVAATCWAWLAFGESPGTTTTVGAFVVLGGLCFGTVGRSTSRFVTPSRRGPDPT